MTEAEVIEARRNLRLAEKLKRDAIIEECARAVEDRKTSWPEINMTLDIAAAAIRALKDKQ